MVEYGVYHADFTPWNMSVEEGQLFVFDWEYASLTYPARPLSFLYADGYL